ncbi:MAG: transcriptional repressor LexA [Carboxydocellales bacterium]
MKAEKLQQKILTIKGDLSYIEFSKAIKSKTGNEIHPTTLQKYIGGKVTPSLDALSTIAEYAGIKLKDLFEEGSEIHILLSSAEQKMERRDKLINLLDEHKKVTASIEKSEYEIKQADLQIKEAKAELDEIYSLTCRIPILGFVPAGGPVMTEENIEGYIPLPTLLLKNTDDFCLKVKGDSMEDVGINNGDLVLVHPQPTAENGQTVIARINGEVTCKRFYKTDSKCILEPANSKYKPIDCEEVEIIGIVVKVIKSVY